MPSSEDGEKKTEIQGYEINLRMRSLVLVLVAVALHGAESFFLQSAFIPSIRGISQLQNQQRLTKHHVQNRGKSCSLVQVRCQSESISGGETTSVNPALNDEILLLMALKQLKKDELPSGSKVLVFGRPYPTQSYKIAIDP
jgi:hypothetical protein